jgi:hypothetical protein
MENILEQFKAIHVYSEQGKPSLHKPVLLLYALAKCHHKQDRLLNFYSIDKFFKEFFLKFSFDGKYENSHYPFGKLENDGIWEVTESNTLKRTSVGHLSKKELLDKNIHGGFTKKIYDELLLNDKLLSEVNFHILKTYFDKKLHEDIADFLNTPYYKNSDYLTNKRNAPMALIDNQKFALSRWWASRTIELVKTNRDIFSKGKLREIRKELIAGTNVIGGIKGWMQAAQLIDRIRTGEYELTNFARSLSRNDPKLDKSASWWAIHLSVCFSNRSEPYNQFFRSLDTLSKDWLKFNELKNRIDIVIEEAAKASLDSNLEGVMNMFKNNQPLAEIGLIETRKTRENGIEIRLGSPKLTDEIIIHALAMVRFNRYISRSSIDFSELSKDGLGHFLCCSPEQLRLHLRRMKQSNRWSAYFDFNEAVNLDSVSFAELCTPDKTLLLLLQEGQDTWL